MASTARVGVENRAETIGRDLCRAKIIRCRRESSRVGPGQRRADQRLAAAVYDVSF
jgi:hypothetical protein